MVTTADLAQLEERSRILKQQQAEERKKRERERLEKEADQKIKKMKRDADEKAAKAARLQQEKAAKQQKLHLERAEKEKAAALFSRTQTQKEQQQQQQQQQAHSNEVAAMRTFAEAHPTGAAPQPPQANTSAAAASQQLQQQQQQQQVGDPTKVVGVTISSAGVASLSVKEGGGIIPEHHKPFATPGVIHPNSNDNMDEGERDTRRELFRIPAHSTWFRWDSIHEIEKASLPEFFNNKSAAKTPKIYKEYRDFMIDMFREHPQRKLVFTQCRYVFLSIDLSILLECQAQFTFSFVSFFSLY